MQRKGEIAVSVDAGPSTQRVAGASDRLKRVIERAASATPSGRAPVSILVATKACSLEVTRAVIMALSDAGLPPIVGESRVQELTAKEPNLVGLSHETHFIGTLQTNKVGAALPHLASVQTVDRAGLAEALGRRAAAAGRTLDVMVQVNTSAEPTKHGCSPDDVNALVEIVAAQESLRLKGFMTIGAHSTDANLVRASYAALRQIRDRIAASGMSGTADARELSMGMSGDLELAIAEGATMIRVGTAVTGGR